LLAQGGIMTPPGTLTEAPRSAERPYRHPYPGGRWWCSVDGMDRCKDQRPFWTVGGRVPTEPALHPRPLALSALPRTPRAFRSAFPPRDVSASSSDAAPNSWDSTGHDTRTVGQFKRDTPVPCSRGSRVLTDAGVTTARFPIRKRGQKEGVRAEGSSVTTTRRDSQKMQATSRPLGLGPQREDA
jgi:hypothetical protein